MGDMGDMWNELKEESKKHRHDKQNWSKELLLVLCVDHGIEMREIAAHQFRLFKAMIRGDKKIDVYPQTQKFHNLKDNSRGKYKDLEAFVIHHFKQQ